MKDKEYYLQNISNRGSENGSSGGLLDLLEWCGKLGLFQVTTAEAKAFWENPNAIYTPNINKD